MPFVVVPLLYKGCSFCTISNYLDQSQPQLLFWEYTIAVLVKNSSSCILLGSMNFEQNDPVAHAVWNKWSILCQKKFLLEFKSQGINGMIFIPQGFTKWQAKYNQINQLTDYWHSVIHDWCEGGEISLTKNSRCCNVMCEIIQVRMIWMNSKFNTLLRINLWINGWLFGFHWNAF